MNNKIVYRISIGMNENIMNGACDNHYRICLRHEGVALILLFLLWVRSSSLSLRLKYLVLTGSGKK